MDVNSGNGLYNRYGLIDSIIVDLDRLEVRGVSNMKIIFDSIAKLNALKEGLRKEEDSDNGKIEA